MSREFTRRAILTGAATVPALAAMPPKKADIITQAEIQGVLDLDREVIRRAVALRRRLWAGATVECGRFSLDDDRTFTPDQTEALYLPDGYVGVGWDGLWIEVAEG